MSSTGVTVPLRAGFASDKESRQNGSQQGQARSASLQRRLRFFFLNIFIFVRGVKVEALVLWLWNNRGGYNVIRPRRWLTTDNRLLPSPKTRESI